MALTGYFKTPIHLSINTDIRGSASCDEMNAKIKESFSTLDQLGTNIDR